MNQNLLRVDKLNIIDHIDDVYKDNIYIPFAIDELLREKVEQGNQGTIHIWRHQRAFVMGLRDYRLPSVQQAIHWLNELGYQVMVRNSGGAAVPLDNGVINISLILPNPSYSYHIHQDFEAMYQLINDVLLLNSKEVEKGEIVGSYCPGDFDLSIHGIKFAGMAQHRKLRSIIIQAFINVDNKGSKRGELVQQFYEIASMGNSNYSYPQIHPDKVASLQELIHDYSSQKFIADLRSVLTSARGVSLLEEQNFDFHKAKQIAKHIKHRYET